MEARLLFLLCVLALGRAAVILNDCHIIQTLHGKLLYDNRVTYMREYFPIDYKLYVKYEEVLRCQNITTLINKGITVKELRYLWGIVNENILQTIQRALPLRHPTRPYIKELQIIFEALLRDTNEEQQVESNQIQEILDRLHQSTDEVKAVTPKALLDNCYKVLYALYEDECALCNPSIIMAL
ncbi:interleukin-34 isoform X2 [Aquarana catesbeiana]|uniref:interleukin-34 isoform X2 n=1 Tax=Aquarana catesbeiana TaxID=8400 RepID=UPI003CC97E3C